MERVSVITGSNPILLVAPHGYDDDYTDELTEAAAESMDCHAVINRGWERSTKVDVYNDKANCNSVKHCLEDVVREEFLEPIQKIVKRNTKVAYGGRQHLYVFYIHGMGDQYRKKIDPKLDLVVGYGEGFPPRLLCQSWRKDLFIHTMEQSKYTVYQAGPDNPFAAWDRDNMAQFQNSSQVSTMQLEFVLAHRKTKKEARITGRNFGHAIRNIHNMASWVPPAGWSPKTVYHWYTGS